jgi:hypothetical protein
MALIEIAMVASCCKLLWEQQFHRSWGCGIASALTVDPACSHWQGPVLPFQRRYRRLVGQEASVVLLQQVLLFYKQLHSNLNNL